MPTVPPASGSRAGDRVRSWSVLLVGGASGTGKSTVSATLAEGLRLQVVAVDDLHLAASALTTPAQQPALHAWETRDESAPLTTELVVEMHLAASHALEPAVLAVVADRLESGLPTVIEGDYLLPAQAVNPFGDGPDPRVRGVWLHEDDADAITHNLGEREPLSGEQSFRAGVSRAFGAWAQAEGTRLGVPVVAARPFDTLPDRVPAVLG